MIISQIINTNTKSERLFIKIPNQIIKYSCMLNHMVIPVYIYSAIHCNPYYYNIVDTNISHISETFAPNEDARRQIPQKILDTLIELSKDIEDSQKVFLIDEKEKIVDVKGFSACINFDPEQAESKNSRIQYCFLDRDIKFNGDFTILYYDEYFYLLNKVQEINKQNTLAKNKRWNLIDLINIFLFLKMRITIFNNLSKSKNNPNIKMHETINKMAMMMQVGNKTISKYINELIELKLITCRSYFYETGKSTEYNLSDDWRKLNE